MTSNVRRWMIVATLFVAIVCNYLDRQLLSVLKHLSDFAEHGDKERFAEYYGLECVECGSCSYTCPAKRPLASNIKAMRRTILAERRK